MAEMAGEEEEQEQDYEDEVVDVSFFDNDDYEDEVVDVSFF